MLEVEELLEQTSKSGVVGAVAMSVLLFVLSIYSGKAGEFVDKLRQLGGRRPGVPYECPLGRQVEKSFVEALTRFVDAQGKLPEEKRLLVDQRQWRHKWTAQEGHNKHALQAQRDTEQRLHEVELTVAKVETAVEAVEKTVLRVTEDLAARTDRVEDKLRADIRMEAEATRESIRVLAEELRARRRSTW